MTKFFDTINEYFDVEPRVSVQSVALNGMLVSELDETPNDIAVASTFTHSLLLSLSGSDHHRVRIGDQFREAPTLPGDVALIPNGIDLHSSWRTSGYTLKTVSLEFDTTLFNIFAPEIFSAKFAAGHITPANYAQRPELASLTMLMKREIDAGTRQGTLYSDSVIRLLMLELATRAWSVPIPMPSHGNRSDPRIGRAIDYVEANCLENISLVEIANAAGLSPTHLMTRFRDQTGMTPYSYVINRRVQHAVLLLRTTDMPIADVALEAGFSDQQHLTRVVRARRGLTPKMIRLSTDG
jgi:AraC family transcriptional regulator